MFFSAAAAPSPRPRPPNTHAVSLAHTQAMASSTAEARKECSSWQAQTQDALLTINRLQELLAEATSNTAAAAAQQEASSPRPGDETEAPEREVSRLRASVLQQQVQVTTLELQVRVLSMQLLRSHAACKQASSSVVPLLSGVEARLLALKARAAGS